jgi:type IV pilus assembly protein PilQ
MPGSSTTNFQVPATAASETNEFTGDPISVNLQDVDLKDFFRLIHEISGLNIVVDQSVSGTVTLVLIDVPWDQALDIVLRNNGLDHSLEGNVLRIATRATLKRESEEERDLAQARLEAVAPVTVTKQLNYARAQDVEPTLQRFLSSRGVLIRDERTNTLIIQDIPSVIPALEDLIKQLDRKSQQVEIEARVVTARRNFLREFGVQLGFSSGTRNRKQLWGGGLRGTDDEGFIDRAVPLPPVVSGGAIDTAGRVPLATRLGANAATSGLFYNFASANFALDLILSAAENRGIAKVLSKPRIITQNNVLGFVKQGAKIPVQTEINNTISTQFIDAVLELNVTPQITGDGNVFLSIAIKNDRPDFGNAVNGVPSIVTQEATTQVLVNDGGTVVIGGVMITDNATTIDQVPYLGSIPIIGHLFKRTSVRTSTEELLFFITPRILPD